MSAERIVTNFQRGLLPMLLLQLLTDRDMYGYEMVREIGRRSRGRIITQEGSLYPVLYRLLQMNCITEYLQDTELKRKRTYFHLTPDGRVYLQSLTEEYDAISQGVAWILGKEETRNEAGAPEV
jgi:PadR family transcriptional regulator PadR